MNTGHRTAAPLATEPTVQERAALLLIDAARDKAHACRGSGDGDWICPGCPAPHQCKRTHDEMMTVAVKLRGDL